MAGLAEDYDYVLGGDPDRDSVDVVVVKAATGGVLAHVSDRADEDGYTRLLAWARTRAPGRRVWALEGTGSFAVGLVRALAEAGEDIVEVPGAQRSRGAKSDRIDAVRAAGVALGRERQTAPRARGLREALRQIVTTRHGVLVSRTKAINELKSLIVVAPEHLRAGLRGVGLAQQLERVERLQAVEGGDVESRVTVWTLRLIAARIRFLSEQVASRSPSSTASCARWSRPIPPARRCSPSPASAPSWPRNC